MKRSIFSLRLLVSIAISAQSSEPIVTEEENTSWLIEFEQEELPEQLEMLKQRWEADTVVEYYATAIPHSQVSNYQGKTRHRPLYLILGGDKEQIIFPSNPSSEEITAVSKMLIPKNISEIQLRQGIKAQAIYGTRGSSGVIWITVSDKTIFEKIASELNQ